MWRSIIIMVMMAFLTGTCSAAHAMVGRPRAVRPTYDQLQWLQFSCWTVADNDKVLDQYFQWVADVPRADLPPALLEANDVVQSYRPLLVLLRTNYFCITPEVLRIMSRAQAMDLYDNLSLVVSVAKELEGLGAFE